jgi:hypothetical protein
MPVFGMIFLLAGIALFAYTYLHAPENPFEGVQWVFKPKFYYVFIISSGCFALYGIYEIITELRSKPQESKKPEGVLSLETKKCPSCAEQIESGATVCSFCQAELSDAKPDPSGTCPHCQEKLSSQARFCPQCGLAVTSADKNSCPKCGSSVNPGAQFCEFCGLPIISPTPGTAGPSVAPPLSTRISQKLRRLGTPAVVAAGLLGAIFLMVGLFAWQKLRPAPPQTSWSTSQLEVPQPDVGKAGPVPPQKSPPSLKPTGPPAQESLAPFQVGSTWAIDWRSKYHYRGILKIQKELAPNQYLSRITVTYRTKRNIRKTVSMDGLVTIHGKKVVINCRNPSVSWWDTDNFYLEWQHHRMIGHNVDTKGRRGKAVFTLVEGAQ